MSFIYGQWTKEELEERRSNGSIYQPFQQGLQWYRVKELVVGPNGAKYQAEPVPQPEPAVQPSGPSEPVVIREAFIPPPIRGWARKRGLLGQRSKVGGRLRGPESYLPREVRAAYLKEFGEEALLGMLKKESVDARRLYALEGDYPEQGLYKRPSDKDRAELSPEELIERYKLTPIKVSEARIKFKEEVLAAGRAVTDPLVKQRREALKNRGREG